MASLSPFERHLVDDHLLLTVRGKRGTPVPVLIPKDCIPGLKHLTSEKRLQLPINKAADDGGNVYLFANTGTSVTRACDSIRSVIEELHELSPLSHRERLRSTQFRKYLATTSQVSSVDVKGMLSLAATLH